MNDLHVIFEGAIEPDAGSAGGAFSTALAGAYHPPRGDVRRGCAVVLCNPFGYEAICAHRTYKKLAERLAAAGFPALRFDYPGTGDSSAAPESGVVAAWIESIRAAVAYAQARSGAGEVALFGMRLGGLLALAAGSDAGVASVAVLAPSVRGRAFVREVKVVARAARADAAGAADAAGDRAPGPLERPRGRAALVDVGGFTLPPDALDELEALDALTLAAPPARHALVLGRSAPPSAHERALGSHLESLGVDADVRAIEGFAGIMEDPHESLVPEAILDAVVAWLAARSPAPSPSVAPAVPPSARRVPPSVLAFPGGREEPIAFGEGGRLKGVLCLPADTHPSSRAGVVLGSVGAIHRIGPGGLHVALARALAARGIAALRFDFSGIGESAPAPGEPENALYSPRGTRDMHAAIEALRARGVEHVVAAGLCSGAYAAYHAALEDGRLTGLVIINLPTFRWTPGDRIGGQSTKAVKSTRYYWSAAFEKKTWLRVARGEIHVRAIARALAARLEALVVSRAEATWSALGLRGSPGGEVARSFAALARGKTDVLVVYGANDPGLDELRIHLGGPLVDRPGFRLATLDTDHTFSDPRSKEALIALVAAHLARSTGIEQQA